LSATGIFRAYQNFTLPILQFLTAFDLLVLPAAVRRYHDEGSTGLKKVAIAFSTFSLACTGLYGITICILRRPLVSFLLGEAYLPYADLLLVWLLGPVILAVGRGLEIATRAMERPQVVFYSYVVSSIVAIALFLMLIPSFGLWGAVWSRVGSFSMQTVVLTFFSWRTIAGIPRSKKFEA